MDDSPAAPNDRPSRRYWFAGFRLEPDGTLVRGETPLTLPPEELAVLRLLLERGGEVVGPFEMKRIVWGDESLSNEIVTECIASLQERLQLTDCIQNVYKRGYRVSVAVQMEQQQATSSLQRLAVLPFVCSLSIPESVGLDLAEAVMHRLTAVCYAAEIIAQEAVFASAFSGATALETGRGLDADFILAGSVRAMPGHKRLRAELIRVKDGTPLWVEDLLVANGEVSEMAAELVRQMASRFR